MKIVTRRLSAFVLIAVGLSFLLVPSSGGRDVRAQAKQVLTAGDHSFTIQHGGRRRSYIVHVPRAGSDRPRPVLLAFHGGGGEAEGFQDYAGLDAVADREGVLVVYPNGSGVLPRRLLTWNAGECCGYAMNQRIDDVGFAMAVVDDLAARTSVDRRRLYATGHSNGGMMAYRLGAERADRIAAIVPVAGAYSLPTLAPAARVAMLAIHSVDDPRALYAGGIGPPFPGTDVRASHRPVMEGLERWRRHNGCSEVVREGPPRSSGTGSNRQTATLLEWEGCAHGGRVAHWKLTGVGHGWPGTLRAGARTEIIGPPTTLVNAADEVWRFVAPFTR